MTPIHWMVPGPLDQRTGGYLYDARMVRGLRALGREVDVHELEGRFPDGDTRARASLSAALARVPDGGCVVLDGLAMGGLPDEVAAQADRLRLVALVHHPLCDETGRTPDEAAHLFELERRALASAAGVVVTSAFTARRLRDFGVPEGRIRVVEPGTERAKEAPGPPRGEPPALLCVGSVSPRKAQVDLVRALDRIRDLPWSCIVAGSTTRDRRYADHVAQEIRGRGLEDRIRLVGELGSDALDRAYHRASVFVLPSHYEGYGMALTEALARGLPVVSTTGGAIPWTVPEAAGLLVPPGDVDALARALASVLSPDRGAAEALERLRAAARAQVQSLPTWDEAVSGFVRAVADLAGPDPRTGPAETFDGTWLALREPVDHRSRGPQLTERAVEAWEGGGWSRILDLGAGTGSNVRYLARRLTGLQRWTLVDHDPGLLARARRAVPGGGETDGRPAPGGRPASGPVPGEVHLRVVCGDLADEGLAQIRPGGADGPPHLVTASALLDLVSAAWLDELVVRCAQVECGALFALTYEGSVAFEGAGDPLDERVIEAVNRHQRRDKGLGAALGPEAGDRAADRFRAAGFQVWTEASPWRLAADDRALAAALIRGWAEAGAEVDPTLAPEVEAWVERRVRGVSEGRVQVVVGHVDVLALPEGVAVG